MSEELNAIEAYCQSNGWGCEDIGNGVYSISVSEDKNVIIKQNEDGSFEIPTDKGPMIISQIYETDNDGKTTQNPSEKFDLSCRIGDEEIIIPYASLNLTAKNVEKNDEKLNKAYNNAQTKYENGPTVKYKRGFEANGYCSGNEIIINEEYILKDKKGNLMVDENGCVLRDENGNLMVDEIGKLTYIHEYQHWKNHKEGVISEVGLNQEDVFKLNMLYEVSACMAQAGEIYEQYKQGKSLNDCRRLVGLLPLDKKSETEFINVMKNKENKPDADVKKELAKIVYNGWMNTYNSENGRAFYNNQAQEHAGYAPMDLASERFLTSTNEEYMNRVNKMFSDIHGLGDVSSVITENNLANFDVVSEKHIDRYETLGANIYITDQQKEGLKLAMQTDINTYNEAVKNLENQARIETKNNNNQQLVSALILKDSYQR